MTNTNTHTHNQKIIKAECITSGYYSQTIKELDNTLETLKAQVNLVEQVLFQKIADNYKKRGEYKQLETFYNQMGV